MPDCQYKKVRGRLLPFRADSFPPLFSDGDIDLGHALLTTGLRNGQPVAEVDSERFAEPLGVKFMACQWNLSTSTGFVPLCVITTLLLSATVSS
eukprot:100801-Pelagomonas_calceolata.AAC.2